MKAATVLSLQILLLLLHTMDGARRKRIGPTGDTWRKEDEIGESSDYVGDEQVMPVNTEEFCFGKPRTCITLAPNEEVEGSPEMEKESGESSRVCYKNIRVLITRECHAFQTTDFSNFRISDFCIGEHVTLDGTIKLRVGMSMPASLIVNVSRMVVTDVNGQRSDTLSQESDIPLLDRYEFKTDACFLYEKIVCPNTFRQFCLCPAPAGTILLHKKKILFSKDFLPHNMHYGQFYAHLTFITPEADFCLNISFDRRKSSKIR